MLKAAVVILVIMLAYACVYSLVGIAAPKMMIGNFFKAATGKALDSVQDADYLRVLLILDRAIAVYGLTLAIAGFFILFAAFRKAQKWAWWALLVVGGIGWLWGLVDHILIGDKVGTTLYALGVVIFLVGLLIPVKAFFGKAAEEAPQEAQ